jgi:hypothetical protein
VYFQVPAELRSWLAIRGGADDPHDAIARALVFLAMEAKRPLFIHGRVSESLLSNLGRYQEVVCAVLPRYRAIEVRADEVVADSPGVDSTGPSEAILGFSGGLDSVYSLYTHQQGIAAGRSLSIPHCLFVHGFDIPLEDESYRRAFDSARQITETLNARLFLVRTNVKTLLPFWPNSHGAALAAVLSVFERRHAAGLIASSYESDNPHVLESGYGSTPETDPWLPRARSR